MERLTETGFVSRKVFKREKRVGFVINAGVKGKLRLQLFGPLEVVFLVT